MIKLILIKDVPELGAKGNVVVVADGYARNYLLPRNLAVSATAGALRQAAVVRRTREEALQKALAEAEELAASLVDTRIVVAARAGDEGKLFGSITAADITTAIYKFTGVEVEQGIVSVAVPIKEIGPHEVTIQPHVEVAFQVTLDVIPASID